MLSNIKKRSEEGFTIIEVMIVLAIAGLIMVIVFLAIPQLQRQQRNTRAKDVVNRMKAELENYAGNNNGKYPWQASSGAWVPGVIPQATDGFYVRYLASVDTKDPKSGSAMSVNYVNGVPGAVPAPGTVNVSSTTKCDGESVTATDATGARQYSMSYSLEGNAVYCIDNG